MKLNWFHLNILHRIYKMIALYTICPELKFPKSTKRLRVFQNQKYILTLIGVFDIHLLKWECIFGF